MRPTGPSRARPLLRALLLLAALGAVGSNGTAQAASRPFVGTDTGALRTDGLRYAVTQPRAGTIRVTDLRENTRRDLALDCSPRGMAFGGLGGPALLQCGPDHFDDLLLDARTATVRPFPGPPSVFVKNEIGLHWAAEQTTGDRCDATSCGLYTNWRTGEQRTGDYFAPVDLDDPELRPNPTRPGYRVDLRRGEHRLTVAETGPDRLRISSGGRRLLTRPRCGSCSDVQLTARAATWVDYDRAYLYSFADRRLRTFPSAYEGIRIAQAGRWVLVEPQPSEIADPGVVPQPRRVRAYLVRAPSLGRRVR